MMMNDMQRAKVRMYGTLIARVLIGGLFLYAGIGKIMGFAGTASYIASAGLPLPEVLTILTILVEVGAGAGLILGYRMGLSAAALVVFTVLAAVLFHGPASWDANPMQQTMFLKNLAIAGGLLYMMAYGAGDGWALGGKKAAPMGGGI